MRTLQYPEERINWLEEHKAINNKLGDELRAFAAISGLDGPAQMYGFTNDARVRSASITSPIRSAYVEMRENSGKIKEIVCEDSPKRTSSPSLVVTDPLTNALQIALAQAKVRSDYEVSKHSQRIQALDTMSENVIGMTMLPLSVVPDVKIDNIMYTIPVSTEEPSVVAALAHAAKIFRSGSGIRTLAPVNPFILGQIVFILIDGQWNHPTDLSELEQFLSNALTKHLPNSRKYGKGIISCYLRKIDDYVLLEIELDPGEAMGANMINGFLEAIAPDVEDYLMKYGSVERLTSILSNSGAGREYEATAKITVEEYAVLKNLTIRKAAEILKRIETLSRLAEVDVNRRLTHNKGVLNGVVGVALACGQDTRAISVANGHIGHSKPLVTHRFNDKGMFLQVTARISAPVGVIGGSSTMFWGLSILSQAHDNQISSSSLGRILAAVGLLQNFAALQALVTNGIQYGHMKLHNRKFGSKEPQAVEKTAISTIATTCMGSAGSSIATALQADRLEDNTTSSQKTSPFRDSHFPTLSSFNLNQDKGDDRDKINNSDSNSDRINTTLNESLKRITEVISNINYTPKDSSNEAKTILSSGESELYKYFSPTKLSPIRNLQQPTLRMSSPKRQTCAFDKLGTQTLLERTRTRSPTFSYPSNSTNLLDLIDNQPPPFSTYTTGLSRREPTYLGDNTIETTSMEYGRQSSSPTLIKQKSYGPNRLNSFSIPHVRVGSPVKGLEMDHWEGSSGARNEASVKKRPYNILSPKYSKYAT